METQGTGELIPAEAALVADEPRFVPGLRQILPAGFLPGMAAA